MLLDIAFGILLSLFAKHYLHMQITVWLVLVCVLFSMAPDMDALFFLLTGKKINFKHRELLHYPVIFAILGMAVYIVFGREWGILFLLGIAWHFFNDVAGCLGWGIRLFWPFSRKNFRIQLVPIHQAPGKPKLPYKFLYIWTPEEVEKNAAQYGDPDWIRNIFFRINSLLIIEIIGLVVALALFVIYGFG
jgi:membrane-bound metal-dependent hydrolase YbcI (DUF457 family)